MFINYFGYWSSNARNRATFHGQQTSIRQKAHFRSGGHVYMLHTRIISSIIKVCFKTANNLALSID